MFDFSTLELDHDLLDNQEPVQLMPFKIPYTSTKLPQNEMDIVE